MVSIIRLTQARRIIDKTPTANDMLAPWHGPTHHGHRTEKGDMGWKNLRNHYGIEHIVQVTDGRILIGSAYISDLMVVESDGTVSKKFDRGNAALNSLQEKLLAEPEQFRTLMEAPDEFERSIPVYTFDGSKIVEKKCEELGWPNVTHDGLLMYDNVFSPDKETAIKRAFRSARSGIRIFTENVALAEDKLAQQKALLATEEDTLRELEALYPEQV
jgi:hypothetical protein